MTTNSMMMMMMMATRDWSTNNAKKRRRCLDDDFLSRRWCPIQKTLQSIERERAQTEEEKDSLWLRGIVVVVFFIFQRRLVRARLEQDFLAQTKFQSDDDSFLAALFSVFVDMTFLCGVFGPVDEGMYSP